MVFVYILCGILGVILVLLSAVLIRAAMFKPKNNIKVSDDTVEFDRDRSVENLQKLITFRTVSNVDPEKEDNEEFEKLVNELPKLYPEVFKTCEFKRFDGRALLFKWKGRTEGDPSVLMAHYDVVPVDESAWEEPPFDGVIKDGYLWGRGSIDTKVTFNATLTAANELMKTGFVPEKDIYMAFSGGEEVAGPGAGNIVDYFEKSGICPSLVIDEGGAVVEGVFPGVKEKCGLIGIAEKGMINVTYTAKSAGGHASAPKPHTPIGTLSKACANVEKHPFGFHLTKPVAEMFDTLGRRSTFTYRMIFANLWLFKGVLDKLCVKSDGELNALVRTTVAFTQMKGSDAFNVIPTEAKMLSNIRLNPEDSIQSAIGYLNKVIGDETVKVAVDGNGMEPTIISDIDCDGYKKVASAVASTWKGTVIAPYLMVQGSDSRRYQRITDKIYRFSAVELSKEERSTIHGNNERIKIETVKKSVEFYIRLIKSC